MVAVDALLHGLVALNVAVLQLNIEAERLDAKREKLATENEVLASELSSVAAAWRIEALATRKLGLVPPVETTYLRLESRRP